MKKNPLEEIYASKVLLNEEASKSNVVVPAGQLKIAKGDKVPFAAGGATEKVKKDLDDADEAEGSEVLTGKASVLKDSMEAPKKSFEGSFERLFKSTINEEFPGEEAESEEIDVEVPTTDDEMVDELKGETDEVSDLVSDLKAVMDHLQTILDKISGEEEAGEEEEMEFGEEAPEGEEENSETEEEAVGESVDMKHLPDSAGKKLQSKTNRVGSIKAKGGKASGGDIDSDPKLKPAKSFDKSLQNTKKFEAKSSVKKGEFFK